MARGIKEGDGTAVYINGICADVLGDAAGLAGNDVCMADIVEQRGLAVVDVTHDNNDGSARNKILRLILMVVDKTLFDRDDNFLLDLAAELHRDKCRSIVVYHIGDGRKHAHLEQLLYDLGRSLLHARGKLAHGDLIRYLDLELLLLGDLKLELIHLVALFLTALRRGKLCLRALLGLAGDLLLVAAAQIIVVRLRAGHILELLVVLFDVDSSAAAGIDNALLRDLTRGVRLILLDGRCLLRRRCARLRGRLILRLCSGLIAGLCGGSGLCRLCCLGLCLLRLGLRRDVEDVLKTCHLIMLGHIIKDNIQLVILKDLHVILRRGDIVREYLRYHLGRDVKILRHLMYSVLYHAHAPVLLLSFLLPPLRAAVSFLRRAAFACLCSIVSAACAYISGFCSLSAFISAFAKPISVTAAIEQPPIPSAFPSSSRV